MLKRRSKTIKVDAQPRVVKEFTRTYRNTTLVLAQIVLLPFSIDDPYRKLFLVPGEKEDREFDTYERAEAHATKCLDKKFEAMKQQFF